MRTSSPDRAGFSSLLNDLRKQRDVTQRWIATELARRGHDVATQSVSGWERGAYAPDRPKAQALDDLLGAEGRLLEALGYSTQDEPLDERVALLEKRVAKWEAELASTKAEIAERDAVDAFMADLPPERREAFRQLTPAEQRDLMADLADHAQRRDISEPRGA